MKKLTAIILAIVTSLIFTSCANVPEEVQSKIDAEKTTAVENTQTEYSKDFINVSELFEKTPKTVDLKSNNLTFKGEVDVPDTSVLYKLALAHNDSWFNNNEEVLKKLSGATGEIDIEIQECNLIGSDDVVAPYDSKALYIDENNYRFQTPNRGTLLIIRYGDYLAYKCDEWIEYRQSIPEFFKVYNDLENLPDDVYKFYDGELSVSQGYEKFKKDFERFVPLLPENQTMDLKYICTYYRPEVDLYNFYIEGTLNYKDVAFNHVNVRDQNPKENNNQSVLYAGYQANVITSKFDPYISELQNAFLVLDELQEYEKIMPFENAWQLLTEKAGKNLELDFCSAELVYLPHFEDINGYGNEWYRNLEQAPEIFSKPVWCFASREVPGENDSEEGDSAEGVSEEGGTVFYVDAITGEIWSYSPYVLVD